MRERQLLETKRLRVVLDTSIYVSAYLTKNPQSPTAELLRRWRKDEFVVLYSKELLHEITRKFVEKGIDIRYVIALIADLRLLGECIEIATQKIKRVIVDDSDDDVIVACAIEGKATHIVTYDSHFDFFSGNYQEIKVVDGLHFLFCVREELC
ncbi:MAG: putative toxin-antitoxin system toxin component, PIN family [Nitrospirota bacterium]